MLPVYFAPLQGFTECAYRQAHFLYAGIRADGTNLGSGITAYYTPFLRVEKGTAREKDLRDLRHDLEFIKNQRTNVCHCENQGYNSEDDSPNRFYNVIPQVICRDATEFRILIDAIQKLKKDCGFALDEVFPHIDINMGCPFPMQAKAGRGSGLLPRLDAVKDILDKVAALSSLSARGNGAPLSFSVKMRLGYTAPEECIALLPLLNDAPLTHITMHPRLGVQQYKGALDFQAFEKFAEGCKHPLIFNGDITSVADINAIARRFPNLAGIMIGRGLLANPAMISGAEPLTALLKIHDYILGSYRKCLQGDAQILDKIRPFWTYPAEAAQDPTAAQKNPDLTAALPKRTIKKIAKARNLNDYLNAVNELR